MYKIKHTSIVRRKIIVAFKCKYCGQISTSEQTLQTSTDFRHRGDSIFKGSVESREYSAKMKAEELNDKLAEQVLKDAENRKYSAAKFNCRCAHCKRKPLWARMSYGLVRLLSNLLLYAGFMVSIFSLLAIVDRHYREFTETYLPIIAVLFGGFFLLNLGKIIHTAVIHKKIKKLDEEYLPVIRMPLKESRKISANKKIGYD